MTRGNSKAPGPRGRVTGWLAWFAVLNLLWLLFISAWALEEAILGLFAAAVAATAAEAVREQGVTGFLPELRTPGCSIGLARAVTSGDRARESTR